MPTTAPAVPRGLLTYSFVSQGIYGIEDRLSGILPFFLPIIKEMQGRAFDPQDFVARCNQRYPWSINPDICLELIPRFCKAGWLKEYSRQRGAVDPSYVVLSITDYEADEQHLQRALSELEDIGTEFHVLLEIISPL
jgi:hypothetical protein